MRSNEKLKLPPIFGVRTPGKLSYDGVSSQETDRSSETESDSSAHRKSSRKYKSFKQVINMIGKNSKWTKDANEEVQADKSIKIAPEEKQLTFNVNAFKADVRSVGFLSPEVKMALIKPTWDRSREDLALIQALVTRIKAFETHPFHLNTELAHVLFYEKFGEGRVVIKQGHLGESFYFIVAGKVIVQREEKDDRTGEKHIQGKSVQKLFNGEKLEKIQKGVDS